MPVDDATIQSDIDIEDFSVNIERNPSYLTIFLLDCGKPYMLKNTLASNTAIEGKGLSEIKPPVGAFIQYAYAIN
ncbi:unnamed protein product [Rotaria sp. Silwood2]|nr:unnamed protein product [Rotaria sp. Silwood2]CAF4231223.1 unnamed protein product [Rotaria sp. Silwood2]CAF4264131.1 unnamed protein product [Rotaria sp. Silwood2]CAF4271762.1 unnamed protein product [Rotaria sp. Silwood2]